MKKFASIALLAVALCTALTVALKPQRDAEARRSEARAEGRPYVAAPASTATTNKTEGSTKATADEPSGKKAEEIELPHYAPSRGGQLIRHTGYTVQYDADYKTPQWVAWELTAAEAEGTEPRGKHFMADPQVRGASAQDTDYKGSGYDRGHMAPAADMKWSSRAMEESFYLSNICPQNRNLNRGDWKDLEELTRHWALRYGAVSIAAGPIYETKSPKRIGANRVAVPDAFFKVLLVGYPENPKAYGFIFKNEAGSRPLSYYQLTVDEVERRTKMDFFPALPDNVEQRIEAQKPAL